MTTQTLQGREQEAYRQIAGVTTGTWEQNALQAWESMGVSIQDTFNGSYIKYLQALLNSTLTDLTGLIALRKERFGNAYPEYAAIGPLNAISGISAAYSLRRLRTSYLGKCIRIRRNQDDVETDIGYASNGSIDLAAVNAFLAASSPASTIAYVTTWYDQSGNGSNATQISATAQPVFNATGLNSKPAVTGATNHFFSISPNFTLTGQMNFIAVNARGAFAGLQILGNATANNKIGFINTSAGKAFVRMIASGSSDSSVNYPTLNTPNIYEVTRDSANKVDVAFNGGALTRIFSDAAQSGNFVAQRLLRDDVTAYWQGPISEVIVLSQKLSTGDRTSLIGNIGAYWGISV